MSHHLQTLPIVTRPVLRILILSLTCLAHRLLPIPMRPIDAHETLPFSLKQVHLCIIEPSVDEVAMETVSIANLYQQSTHTHSRVLHGSKKKHCTSPQANLKGGTPFHPPRIAFLVSYLTENLNRGNLFIFPGHLPPLLAAYA